MLIAGASRHAKEILDILYRLDELNDVIFFDDISYAKSENFYDFKILQTLDDAKEQFKKDKRFVLGLGGAYNRWSVYNKLVNCGGIIHSIVAASATIGHYNVSLGEGLNIMHAAFISSEVSIGKGTLINAFTSVHHDVTIGQFCEISPRATLLGGCNIGDFSSVGSTATILPDVTIGQNVKIGAGTIITKDIPDNSLVVGVPGKVVKKLENLYFT
jgi:sugar O-acyltransferase (sialic acid O-acetyltransferase NeuD family)